MNQTTKPFVSSPQFRYIIAKRIVHEVYNVIFANQNQRLMNDIGFYIEGLSHEFFVMMKSKSTDC